MEPQQIEAAAMQLSIEERLSLARKLMRSIDEDAAESDEQFDRVWGDEVERRVERYGMNGATLCPDEVHARIRNKFDGTLSP